MQEQKTMNLMQLTFIVAVSLRLANSSRLDSVLDRLSRIRSEHR